MRLHPIFCRCLGPRTTTPPPVWSLVIMAVVSWSGCQSVSTHRVGRSVAAAAAPARPLRPPPSNIFTNLPKTNHHFTVRQKLNPVWWAGNVDSPNAPDSYRPGQPGRVFWWHLRNPCHNFTFFVIGLADRPFTRTGKFPERNFNPAGGWNWTVCRYHWLRLPFLSHQNGWFKFYCGWWSGGNFGMQLKISARKTVPPEKPKPTGPGSERK